MQAGVLCPSSHAGSPLPEQTRQLWGDAGAIRNSRAVRLLNTGARSLHHQESLRSCRTGLCWEDEHYFGAGECFGMAP